MGYILPEFFKLLTYKNEKFEISKTDLDIKGNFYSNINTLIIEETEEFKDKENASASYKISENKIYFLPGYKSSLFHEFLHMISTILDKDEKITGFYHTYTTPKMKLGIGIGLTEGYTDLLANRYFNTSIQYNIEEDIAEIIELLIGRRKMEHLYLTSNQYGLIKELEKYTSLVEVSEFLMRLDDICIIGSKKELTEKDKDKINNIYNTTISSFLRKCADNYIKNDEQEVKKKKKLFF